MRSSLRFLGRSSLLLCVLILLSAGFVFAWFASWRADRLASLNSVSELEKTPQGLMEFVARGEGPPVLILHGAPGGYDQAMLLGSSLLEDHFHIVAPVATRLSAHSFKYGTHAGRAGRRDGRLDR